eukprot:CAMPEP_0201535790 /NCGR_PEP_ID=MMETSP0161_2-20130828/60035_1 /ASSEMBLY_ACC=CAM_ASM_000251 /TAXON_ID=180227 /ORGANISM="Neoparamoeba aestuarina, Strain SoJaBio B1-5/56/2" /LENGTH=73 /DNA_ID=CAMNT_0047941149 /DNA_START=52 /DNA_END=269 /DNA_ORIENTATION=-
MTGIPDSSQLQYAFTVDATSYPASNNRIIHRALRHVDQISILSREGFDLRSTKLAVGEYRYMTASEIEHFERA